MVELGMFSSALRLTPLYSLESKTISFSDADINRPGLQFSGFFDYFPHERLQLIGKAEMTYLKQMDMAVKAAVLDRYMSYHPPCIIISRGMECPPELLAAAERHGVPLFVSEMTTSRVSMLAINWLGAALAPSVTLHGVLISVDGVGLLLTGENGIGKSESALEMVKRGHAFVADDAVEIRRVNENRLIGQSPPHIRNFMEIRGVGLIDVRAMFGVSAIINSKSIDLNIHMETWDEKKSYERLGFSEEHATILDVSVPRLVIPVRPGRNLAITLEVAAKNYRLKTLGYNAGRELEKRIDELIMQNSADIP